MFPATSSTTWRATICMFALVLGLRSAAMRSSNGCQPGTMAVQSLSEGRRAGREHLFVVSAAYGEVNGRLVGLSQIHVERVAGPYRSGEPSRHRRQHRIG